MIDLSTRIVEVSVYPDRARVTRSGTVAVDAGKHAVTIGELPLSLDTATVRARGRFKPKATAGRARLLGIEVHKTFFQDTPAARAKSLEDQIRELEDADKVLADKAEAMAVQGELARSVAEKAGEHIARGVAFARADMTQGVALMGFVAQELERTQDALRDVAVQRRDLAKQLDVLRAELNVLRSSRGTQRYTATVEVEASAAGELTVDVIYVVSDAGWQPLYDIWLDGEILELSYFGQIAQRSGEDWSGVSLTLSTARPALSAVLPELRPWYVHVLQPVVAAPTRAPGAAPRAAAQPAPALASMEMRVAAAEPQAIAMEAVTASVEGGGASVTFRLPQAGNIPSDGEPHKVSVAVAKLDPKMDFVSAPKLAEFAYRRATVQNAGDLMLLPGQASLFVEGDFIGTTTLKLVAPGEEFELYLGVDDRVYVKRELKAREVDKKFLQDRRQLRYGYEIELRNLRPGPITVEIHDQLPVPRHESIKVKLEGSDPKPADQSELGELTWKLSLDPGAKRFIRFDFGVEHPRDIQVAGLP